MRPMSIRQLSIFMLGLCRGLFIPTLFTALFFNSTNVSAQKADSNAARFPQQLKQFFKAKSSETTRSGDSLIRKSDNKVREKKNRGEQRLTVFSDSANDSVKNASKHAYSKVDSLQKLFYQSADSIKKRYAGQADRLILRERYLQNKIDSLTKVGEDATNYEEALRRSRNQLFLTGDSLNREIGELKSRTVKALDRIPGPARDNNKLTDVKGGIAGFKLPVGDFELPTMNLHASPLKNLDGQSAQMLTGFGRIEKIDLPSKQIDLKVTDGVGLPIDGFEMSQLNLDGIIEKNAGSTVGLGDVALLQSDMLLGKDSVSSPKELVKRYLEKEPGSLFAGNEDKLKAAMESVALYKHRFGSFNSLRELPKRPPNPMRGKPLRARLLPSVQYEVFQVDQKMCIDINAAIAYRLSARVMTGGGWNYRIAYDRKEKNLSSQNAVHGPRIFSYYKLKYGFSTGLLIESMYCPADPFALNDGNLRHWVSGVFTTLKRDFKISNKLRGFTLVTLRVFRTEENGPYPDMINMRFGFELPQKARTK